MQFWDTDISADNTDTRVLLARGDLIDNTRTNDDGSVRTVPFKLYYPADYSEQCPVIFWSHGYGGSRDGAGFLARYLASHGYILVHLTHTGTDSSLWEGKEGHPWDVLRKHHITRATTLNRYRDIRFVLDTMPGWLALEKPEVARIADFKRLGMSGHSFGAITTQVVAGQLTPGADNTLISLHEPRFTAGILYSPVPGTSHLSGDGPENHPVNIYESIAIPLLHMTGTEDSSPIGDSPYTDRLIVHKDTPDHVGKALLVKEDGDHMVYNGTRGQLAASDKRDLHEAITKIMTLAWWDYHLKGSVAAQDWLAGAGVENYLGADAQWTHHRL